MQCDSQQGSCRIQGLHSCCPVSFIPIAKITHSFCTVSRRREKNIASMNMAMYLSSNALDVHLLISGTVISVILDMVDLLYLLWNNSSRISANFLVDTPFEYIDTTRSSMPMLR